MCNTNTIYTILTHLDQTPIDENLLDELIETLSREIDGNDDEYDDDDDEYVEYESGDDEEMSKVEDANQVERKEEIPILNIDQPTDQPPKLTTIPLVDTALSGGGSDDNDGGSDEDEDDKEYSTDSDDSCMSDIGFEIWDEGTNRMFLFLIICHHQMRRC